jgi:hypothetical protein
MTFLKTVGLQIPLIPVAHAQTFDLLLWMCCSTKADVNSENSFLLVLIFQKYCGFEEAVPLWVSHAFLNLITKQGD